MWSESVYGFETARYLIFKLTGLFAVIPYNSQLIHRVINMCA